MGWETNPDHGFNQARAMVCGKACGNPAGEGEPSSGVG